MSSRAHRGTAVRQGGGHRHALSPLADRLFLSAGKSGHAHRGRGAVFSFAGGRPEWIRQEGAEAQSEEPLTAEPSAGGRESGWRLMAGFAAAAAAIPVRMNPVRGRGGRDCGPGRLRVAKQGRGWWRDMDGRCAVAARVDDGWSGEEAAWSSYAASTVVVPLSARPSCKAWEEDGDYCP